MSEPLLPTDAARTDAYQAADSHPLDLPPEVGRYRIEGELGHGGMGVVFRGHDPDFGRTLAVKVLAEQHAGREDLERRFLAEAHVTARLQHPGIAPVHALGRLPDGRPFFSMKLIEGRTLAELLREQTEERGRLLKVFEQVCQTLAYAHSQGVIHRDLKPLNVMVGAFGEVQVLDWGLAKDLAVGRTATERTDGPPLDVQQAGTDPPTGSSLTQAGAVVGTFAYMPPEQAHGENVDARADVFGLGAMLCEILTGKPPYAAADREGLYAAAHQAELGEAFARLDSCGADAGLVALAKRCLAARRDERPRDGGEVASALTAYLAGVDERVRRAEQQRAAALARAEEAKATAAAERRAKRLTGGLAAAVLLLVVAGGAVAWVMQHQRVMAAARREQATVKARDRMSLARSACQAGWGTNDVELIAASLTEATRAVDLAGDADPQARQDAAAVRQEVQEKLDQARKNRTLLAAILDVAQPRETDSYRGNERGMVVALALPSPEEQFAAAFRVWGIDVEKAPLEEVVSRLQAQPGPVVQELVAGLDQWALTRRRANRPADSGRLLALADRLDVSPLRKQVRALLAASPPKREADAAEWDRTRAALVRLASKIDAPKEPVLGLLLLAETSEAFGETALAERLLRSAVAVHRNEVLLLYALGKFHGRQKPARGGEAIECYRAACAVRPQLGVALGMALLDGGRSDEGESVLRDLVSNEPNNPERHFYHGYALRTSKKLDEAAAAYRKAIELRPDLPEAHTNLGNILDEQGDPLAAIAAYQQALDLRPDNATAHNNLGKVLSDQGKRDAAILALHKALAIDPTNPEAHTNLGIALSEKKQFEQALVHLRAAVEHRPDFAAGHTNLGVTLDLLNRLPEALAAHRKAIELRPDLPEPHNNLALVLLKQQRLDDALAACRKAIEIRPNYPEAHSNLGLILAEKKQLAEAVAAHSKAIELRADYAEAHTNLGVALRAQGKLDEAAKAHREAIRLRPDFAEPRHNLGIVLAAQKKPAQAVKEYREAIRLRSDYPEAYASLGRALAELNQWEEAVAAYQKSIELRPAHAETHHDLGLAYADQRQYDRAIPAFGKAVEYKPNYPEAQYNLALALAQEKQFAQAAAACRKAIEFRPDYAEAHHNLGVISRQLKQLDEALACFQKADKLLPKHPAIQNQIRITQLWIALDQKFPDVLAGKSTPNTAQEHVDFAEFCAVYKEHHRAAVRFYAEAFDADDKLAARSRAAAARSAALAAAGKGKDAADLDDKERDRLRRQALRWLRADLTALGKFDEKAKGQNRLAVRALVAKWKTDADLASIREKEALETLPEDDRAPFLEFWANVDALLAKLKKDE